MDKIGSVRLGDQSTSDTIIRLIDSEGKPETFHSHSSVLVNRSKYFSSWFSNPNSGSPIDIHCSDSNYDHHLNFLKLLYLPTDSLLKSLTSVKSAIGILEVSTSFGCEEITKSCLKYLEAVPWDDKEEEQILKVVPKMGPAAMPVIARIQPVDASATKDVFISAIRFATSIADQCPPFGDEIKMSAQEQIEYMLVEDEDTPLVTSDDEVKSVVKMGLTNVFSAFETQLSALTLDAEVAEEKMLQILSDLQWMCAVLPKMDLMKELVLNWVEISSKVLHIVEDEKLESSMWGLKVKLIEVTAKVLEAVGYGNVIIASQSRVQLLNDWLPYVRKMKPILDSKCDEDSSFEHKMDEDLCQTIEGAIVSIILALPSNDQADILADWMERVERVKFPDLSEAFEVWCYRTKSAKRRLVEGLDKVGDRTTFDLSI